MAGCWNASAHAGWLADGAILNPLHVGELVIDGGTLSHILGTEMEQELAKVGAQCGSVVICRSSPSQKAAIVHMMSEYEMSQVRAIRRCPSDCTQPLGCGVRCH